MIKIFNFRIIGNIISLDYCSDGDPTNTYHLEMDKDTQEIISCSNPKEFNLDAKRVRKNIFNSIKRGWEFPNPDFVIQWY